ncbi:NAD(P)/FAD-dependent oxidoreductase [Nitrosospira multiformis]|uniref:NAD(P)-binding Rossmann-like domain-containing protein n=1 Tax=Nitrosospira multiformis TaxID=1231 RepID=A0A1I7I1F1_9PROT|nr:NAD(P)/FAD-dependent oxidoreductase [Nitrosospira multiformis]SFU66737.1 NAD(P)-binding Rossmann-like domain-containing protein [Nitrosospira multiformis]
MPGSTSHTQHMQHTQKAEIYDLVIVGGGIAGLYCCHELIKKVRDGSLDIRSILLLEASDRFGGRIETWSLLRSSEENGKKIGFEDTWDPCNWNIDDGCLAPPDPQTGKQSPFRGPTEKSFRNVDGNDVEKLTDIEYFRAEFGPMRIEPRDQILLQGLLDDLGIREPDPGEEESLDDLVPFSSYTSEDPMAPRFTLQEEEAQQKTPFDLMILALRRIFELVHGPKFDGSASNPWYTDAANEQWRKLHSAQFFYRHYWKGELLEWIQYLTDPDFVTIREHARFRDQPLWDLGFWNVLSDVLSHYAVVKIRDWGSYYHFVHENLNAAEWIIFWLRAIRSTGSLRGIRGGMSRIIWNLLEVLRKHQDSHESPRLKIAKGARVVSVERRDNALVALTVQKQDEVELVRARRVIFALPKRPLEEMSWNGERPKGNLYEALNAVVCLPLLKCFFVIEKPWWEDNRSLNRYASDIPTRELLYVKSRDRTKGLIMIYTDRPAITFWSDYLRSESSNNSKGPEQPEGPQVGYQDAARIWFLEKKPSPTCGSIIEIKPGSARLWQRFVQFARDYEHHDFTTGRLLACGMRDWGKEPFGAAAHGWRPGVKSREHIEFLEAFSLEQEEQEAGQNNLHVCGEAFSDYQGFIEGSLRSAQRVLAVIERQQKPGKS